MTYTLTSKSRRLARVVCTTAVAFALVAASSTTALAAPGHGEEVARLIETVAPDQGAVVHGKSSRGVTRVTTGASTIAVAEDPDVPISITGPGGSELQITLPDVLDLQSAQAASDGTIVYSSNDGGVDAAVQIMADGAVRIQTVIQNRKSAHEFAYGIVEGFQPVEAADGSFWAVGFNAAGDFQAVGVGEAWARDADGNAVPTHYEISENDLVQIVTPAPNTKYPIVADPIWQWYNFAYGAGFSKAETRSFASTGSITGLCGLLGKWPALGVACAIAGVQWFLQASYAANANGCVFLAAVPAPLAVRWVSPQCR